MGDGGASCMEKVPEPNEPGRYRNGCDRSASSEWNFAYASISGIDMVFSTMDTVGK